MERALRVAIVGSGPSALYSAVELLRKNDGVRRVTVHMFERLPVPGGLARFGVAPDHWQRRGVIDACLRLAVSLGPFRFYGNVEIGQHLSHADLMRFHDAVIYACGAAGSRTIGIPGEALPGSHAAIDFARWYNGHPDFRDTVIDLTQPRAVVIGNGNVALDVARILLSDTARLARGDIAVHALDALAKSAVREVVVLGRRGGAQSSFTVPELLELHDSSEIALRAESIGAPEANDYFGSMKHRLLSAAAARPPDCGKRQILLRFHCVPVSLLGQHHVEGIELDNRAPTAAVNGGNAGRANTEILETGLVVRAVGQATLALPGLPLEGDRRAVPNRDGRVLDGAGMGSLSRAYVVGWMKRGPTGVIGSNRSCARQTVASLLDDWDAGRLQGRVESMRAFDELLRARQARVVDLWGWRRIKARESEVAQATGRACAPLIEMADMLDAAQGE